MKKQRFLFALAMVALVAVSANAANLALTWDNDSGDNNWLTASNWNPNISVDRLGLASDSLGTYYTDLTVNSGSSVNLLGQYWAGVNKGSTLTINGADVLWESRYSYIGKDSGGADSVVTVNGGSLTNLNNVASYPGSGGKLNIGDRGNGKLYLNSATLTVGDGTANDWGVIQTAGGGASGRLEIAGTSVVNCKDMTNGWDGQGVIKVIGSGSDINVSGTFKNSMGGNKSSQLQFVVDDGGVSTIDAGAVQIGGGALVVWTGGRTGSWDLMTYSSLSGTWGGFAILDLTEGQEWSIDYGADTMTLTVIPEPATLALLGLGGLVLRRRK